MELLEMRKLCKCAVSVFSIVMFGIVIAVLGTVYVVIGLMWELTDAAVKGLERRCRS